MLDNRLSLDGKTIKDYLSELKRIFSNNSLESICNQLSYSFILAATSNNLLEMLSNTHLSILAKPLNDKMLAFVSGNLNDWRHLIINFSNVNEQSETRYIVNQLQLYFERTEGLYSLFSNYRKESVKDGTFLLKES